MNFNELEAGLYQRILAACINRNSRKRHVICISFFLSVISSVPLFSQTNHNPDSRLKSEFGPTPALSMAEIQEGWLSLFDGEALFGWHPGTDANWSVKNGCIEVSSGDPGLLRTTIEFDDYELQLEAKIDPQTNSGIFLHTSPKPTDPAIDCIEFNLASRSVSPFPTGSLVKRHATKTDIDNKDWMSIRIVVDGAQVQGWVNGTCCCDHRIEANEKALNRGYIGLQFNSGAAKFRNIKIRPLNVPDLKLTRELEGWIQKEARQSRFSVVDGELQIQSGPGQLELEKPYSNFIFSLDCRTNKQGLNSGIFFRSIPREWMNGYESQIHCGFENGDRSQPTDCGTGGIFRRQNARWVNSNDGEWFRKTIIACGPQISVWVNGYQVTDWRDQRKPDVNPRKGLRLAEGTIILQGHDPTTDVSFREFQIRELHDRKR